MGANERTIGGGPAVGLSNDLVNLLQYYVSGSIPDINPVVPSWLGSAKGAAGTLAGMTPGWTGSNLLSGWSRSGVNAPQPSPIDRTSMVAQGIERLLAPVDTAATGGAIQKVIQTETERGAGEIRSRYGAAGGTSLGTPGAVAEAMYRAEAAPRAGVALGQLDLAAKQLEVQRLMPLLQLIAALAGKGIPQAQAVLEENPWIGVIGALSGGASGAGDLMKAIKG